MNPSDVTVVVEDGSAGFDCHEDRSVKKVNEGGTSEAAGLRVGMSLSMFQGKSVADKTWAQVRDLVKAAPKPWTLVFSAIATPLDNIKKVRELGCCCCRCWYCW